MNHYSTISRCTIQEAKQFLSENPGEYIISRVLYLDSREAWTRVMVWLKKTSAPNLKPFANRYPPLVNSALTIPELIDKLTESQKSYPNRKFVFDERLTGEIHLVFDIPTPMEYLADKTYRTYSIADAGNLPNQVCEYSVGSKIARSDEDKGLGNVYIIIQLDQKREWYLKVCFNSTGLIRKYILDYEGNRYESHYEFRDERSVREVLYQIGDEDRTLDELFIRYIKDHSGDELVEILTPYITLQSNYE